MSLGSGINFEMQKYGGFAPEEWRPEIQPSLDNIIHRIPNSNPPILSSTTKVFSMLYDSGRVRLSFKKVAGEAAIYDWQLIKFVETAKQLFALNDDQAREFSGELTIG